MPTAGWLRRVDLPLDAAGRSYIDPPNLDQILDQFVNWRGDVNGGGKTLSNVILAANVTGVQTPWATNINAAGYALNNLGVVTQDAFINATLLNSWVPFLNGWPAAGLLYRKDKQACVWIIGAITGGVMTDGTLIMILPLGFRPGGNRASHIRGSAGTPSCLIGADGAVTIFGVTSNTWLTFNFYFPL